MSGLVGRRTFAKSLGLFGLVAAGVQGYAEAKERIVYKQDELPTKELEAQLEGKPVLQLQATYGTLKPKPLYNLNQYHLVSGLNDEYVEVA